MKNQDYEQMYYDLFYKYKELKQKYEDLYLENQTLLASKSMKLKQILYKELRRYINENNIK